MIEPWNSRPAEVAHLLNPAFTGGLLRLAIDGYVSETPAGMPFAVAFLALPIALHKHTIERLPTKVTFSLPQWIQDNRDILIGFSSRVKALVPFTREGLLFTVQRKVVTLSEAGTLTAGSERLRGITSFAKVTSDIASMTKRSTFVGRWFATSGSAATLFSLLGVTP